MNLRSVIAAILVFAGAHACVTQRPAVAPLGQSNPGVVMAQATAGSHRPHGGMLRFPDVSATSIVFVYTNDIWLVPREGGMARPLASPPGVEMFPRFSPDGQSIAFGGNYEGDRDLYTISTDGGLPHRVTHHPANEWLWDWPRQNELLYSTNGFAGLRRQLQLYRVDPAGGLPEKLPVPYGANGALSPDGAWLAYTPHTRDNRTWKRYRGGMATDIWLFNLSDHSSRKITDWEGTDTIPMWHGEVLYYLSDMGPEHRLNIWKFDVKSGQREQITHFDEYDVKWPAVGPGPSGQGEIVFQYGSQLRLLDLASGQSTQVDVVIPGDRPTLSPKIVDVEKFMAGWGVSATGKRALFEMRGDVWTVPAKHGTPLNLTRTSGAAERYPAWSPDGRWIAYFSDASGEYELYITQSDGKGETKRLTHDGSVYRYSPTWSPDSKRITFTDKTGAIWLHTVEGGETIHVDTEPWASQVRVNWSPDSNWIVYTKQGDNGLSAVWIYGLASKDKHQVTSGMFNDTWPTFDRKGDYLFLASNREFDSPIYEDLGTTFVYANTDMLVFVPLREDVPSPWLAEVDQEKWDDESAEDGEKDKDKKEADGKESSGEDKEDADGDEKGDKKDAKEEIKPVVIDFDGFESRAIPLPVESGSFYNLSVNDKGNLIYARGPRRGSEGKPAIKIFDMSKEAADKKRDEREKTVIDGTGQLVMTDDGKKLLVRKDGKFAIVEAAADQKMEETLSVSGMTATIDPREEWRQIFTEVWRVQRDFFYDPNMHGVDWEKMRRQYGAMLDDCVSREDVAFVLGELVSELNVGHAYIRGGGDVEDEPQRSVGMLGADFEVDRGAFRISRVYRGAPWDVDAVGPLSQPGVKVKEGDFLLAVNGIPLDTSKDPWAAFGGLADKTVTLTVSEKPTRDDSARDVAVTLMGDESDLRYRAWIEHKRAYVEKKTDGRVGYIYVPDTGVNGQNNLLRQFFGQIEKEALIIDERWNGGGQIPTRFIELLNRPNTNYWARRDGKDWRWPPDSHQGPKCMLINGLAGSGGDCFPYYFREAELGKLIGMRTWGGLVGISGNPRPIDQGGLTVPTFAFYENDGTWGIEGHGVDPDIEVIDDPALMVDGGDPQLDRAIEQMFTELRDHPFKRPEHPPYPDRSGMGIKESDK